MGKLKKKRGEKIGGRKWPRRVLIIVVMLAIVIVGVRFAVQKAADSFMSMGETQANYTVQQVERRTIENYLSSSGTVQPLDTYSVTTVSTVEGTILSADFEEGDLVEEGQVLYQISTDSMDSRVESAKKSVERAEKNLAQAEENYNKAQEDLAKNLADLVLTADRTGYVKSLEVEVGDNIQAGNTRLAQIYDNQTMLLSVPFLASDVSEKTVGSKAVVEISDTGEELSGTVSKIAGVDEVLSGHRIVRYVTIEVKNPGAISEMDTAFASIGDNYSCEDGTFSVAENEYITASQSGEISTIYMKEGDWVEKGDIILLLSGDTVQEQAESQLENLQDQIDNAKDNLEDAQDNLQSVYDDRNEYTITSPITGTVIQKNKKAGDTLSASSMNSTLCLIYDLSAMTFEMYVDELDVMSVEAGQTVNITADALEDETFVGVITNVSLVANSSGGVTQYPVTVRIDETGNLLPGMNISGEIVIESSENTLAVPVNALQRGNQVYVQDESVTEAQGSIPAGFRAVKVEVGISNEEYIEILSGLSEGDSIYVPGRSSNSTSGMMPGMDFQGGGMPSGGNGGGNNRGGNGGGNNRGGNSGGFSGPGGGF